ncbi:MAG: hypothetical protein IPF99_00150 [Deltaproteobacteria bacterium]|nr:hypothetical protein [Deltaproteobacteria bacterium]
MNHRRPRTAARSSALPSLAALLASGVVLDGCGASSSEAAERHERLSTHGENAASALGGSRLADGLREIAVGLGLITPTRADIGPAGAAPIVDPQPPPMQPSGAVAPVQPLPPPQPQMHPQGGPMAVNPDPPPPPPPLPPQPSLSTHSLPPPPGGMPMVHPHPPPPVESPGPR